VGEHRFGVVFGEDGDAARCAEFGFAQRIGRAVQLAVELRPGKGLPRIAQGYLFRALARPFGRKLGHGYAAAPGSAGSSTSGSPAMRRKVRCILISEGSLRPKVVQRCIPLFRFFCTWAETQ